MIVDYTKMTNNIRLALKTVKSKPNVYDVQNVLLNLLFGDDTQRKEQFVESLVTTWTDNIDFIDLPDFITRRLCNEVSKDKHKADIILRYV